MTATLPGLPAPAASSALPGPPRTGHAAAVVLEVADEVVVRCVRDVHEAALRTTYALLPTRVPLVALVAGAQGAVTSGVYAAVSGGLRAGGLLARHLARQGSGASVESTPRARAVRSAVNAYRGDRLVDGGDPYALSMTLRSGGADVPLTEEGLAGTYPDAREDVVVFVHGLGESDDSWDRHAGERGTTYPRLVQDRTDATAVLVRYNTGRRIRDNGADLAALLGALVDCWPRPVRRLHLVGHSMGGLVIRSATQHGVDAGAVWPARVASVMTLGTPHGGAPLEQVVKVGSSVLRAVEHSRPFADLMDTRSVGILDLGSADLGPQQPGGADPAGCAAIPAVGQPPDVAHHVAATALPGPDLAPIRWVGDLMVPVASASGARPTGSEVGQPVVHRVRGSHLSLLNHPEVDALLTGLLAAAEAVAQP